MNSTTLYKNYSIFIFETFRVCPSLLGTKQSPTKLSLRLPRLKKSRNDEQRFPKSLNSISVFIVLSLFGSLVSCKENKKQEALLLPVFGEKKAVSKESEDTIYHTIKPFLFKNQFNENVTEQTTQSKIYVADFFFTSCQSICPQMSSMLVNVQKAFDGDDSVLILSHTVNPMLDTVEVLYGYAQQYGAQKNKWHLLTGNKKEIYDLAKESYLVNAFQDDGSPEGFLHSELFVLIDAKRRIRGYYDGTDSGAVVKLIADIKVLKGERNKNSLDYK